MKTDTTWEQLANQITSQLAQFNPSPQAQAAQLRKLFDLAAAQLAQHAPETDFISAPNAVLEIIDASTGTLYRRYLELEVEENDNGIRLLGENISGEATQIAFLSSAALHKMHDLQGKGPNQPHHTHG